MCVAGAQGDMPGAPISHQHPQAKEKQGQTYVSTALPAPAHRSASAGGVQGGLEVLRATECQAKEPGWRPGAGVNGELTFCVPSPEMGLRKKSLQPQRPTASSLPRAREGTAWPSTPQPPAHVRTLLVNMQGGAQQDSTAISQDPRPRSTRSPGRCPLLAVASVGGWAPRCKGLGWQLCPSVWHNPLRQTPFTPTSSLSWASPTPGQQDKDG